MNKNNNKHSSSRSASTGQYVTKSQPYIAKSYKLVKPEDIKLYKPNVVSKRRNIISA